MGRKRRITFGRTLNEGARPGNYLEYPVTTARAARRHWQQVSNAIQCEVTLRIS
jgi:hypothetical protein